MTKKRCQRQAHGLAGPMIIVLIGLLLAAGPRFAAAQEADTLAERPTGKKVIEIEIKDEGITARTSADTDGKKISRAIVIDEDGILLNGKKVDIDELVDSAMKSVTVEGGSVVKVGEDFTVAENEIVDGDLVSVGGDVTVAGTVSGDVAVIGANLYLESTGTIKGDAITVAGALHQEPGARIGGQRVGIMQFRALPSHFTIHGPYYFMHPFRSFLNFGIPLILFIIFSLLLVALVVFFAPKSVARVQQAIEVSLLKSVLLGFAAAILFLPLFVILCITIIGIPVALFLQPIAYFVASIMGFAGVSLFVGSTLDKRSGFHLATPYAQVIVGVLVIELALILAWVFTLGGKILIPLFWLFQLIGWIIISVAGLAGLGAVTWTRFGKRSVIPAGSPIPPMSASLTGDSPGNQHLPEAPRPS